MANKKTTICVLFTECQMAKSKKGVCSQIRNIDCRHSKCFCSAWVSQLCKVHPVVNRCWFQVYYFFRPSLSVSSPKTVPTNAVKTANMLFNRFLDQRFTNIRNKIMYMFKTDNICWTCFLLNSPCPSARSICQKRSENHYNGSSTNCGGKLDFFAALPESLSYEVWRRAQ